MNPVFEILRTAISGSMMPFLLDCAVRSVLILALAGLIVFCMRRAPAAARHLVWSLATLSLLLLPVASILLPRWYVLPDWMGVVPSLDASRAMKDNSRSIRPTAVQLSSVEPYAPAFTSGQPAFTADESKRSLLHDSTSAAKSEASATPASASRALNEPRIPSWKLASWTWLAGAFLALLPLLVGTFSLWWLAFTSLKVTDVVWLELLKRLLTRLRFKRDVALLRSSRRRMPMTWGVLRPKLLLPEEAESWSEEQRCVVLLHELAHVKRWDYLTNLITQFTCALYWFNPLVWMAARRIVAERERACDDIVLRQGAKPADYAEQVLQIAAGLPVERLAAYGAIPMARPSKLENRLLAILDPGRNRAALSRATVLMMSAMLTLIVVPVAMMKAASSEAASKLEPQGERAVSRPVELEIRDEPVPGGEADEPAANQIRGMKHIQLAQAEAELARASQLYEAKLISQSQYDKAKHAVELLQAELKGDQSDIANLKLKHAVLELERVKKVHQDKLVSEHELDQAKLNVELCEDDAQRAARSSIALHAALRDLQQIKQLHAEKLVSDQELREAEFKVALRKAEYQRDPAEVARIRLQQAVESLERVQKLHADKLVSDQEVNQAKLKVELLKAEQKADSVELARVLLRQATEEWDRVSNMYLGKHPLYIEAKKAAETRRAELEAILAERERRAASPKADPRADAVVTRSFVRLVVGPDSLTFEGQKTTWEELPALLDKVSNRPTAVLEFAMASDSLTIAQLNDAQARAGTFSRQFGFEYLSYIGVQPLGSKGSRAEVKAGRR